MVAKQNKYYASLKFLCNNDNKTNKNYFKVFVGTICENK